LSRGPINLIKRDRFEDDWLLCTSDPKISKFQRKLRYEDDAWKFACALFATTFMDPEDGSKTIRQTDDKITVHTD